MGFHLFDNTLYPLHHLCKIKLNLPLFKSEVLCTSDLGQHPCTFDKGFAGNTAGIEAVPTHFVLFNQGNLRLDSRGNVGCHKTRRPRTDDNEIVIKSFRFFIGCHGFIPVDQIKAFFGGNGKNTEKGKGQNQARGEDTLERLKLGEVFTGIDIYNGGRKHADLTDKGKCQSGKSG